MSSVNAKRKIKGIPPKASKNGTANGNGHCVAPSNMLSRVGASVPINKAVPGRYERPYSCVVCGLRLPEEDADNMDNVLSENREAVRRGLVRVMCSCHTGLMNELEFRLLRLPAKEGEVVGAAE